MVSFFLKIDLLARKYTTAMDSIMNTMTYIQFGRELADENQNLYFDDFINRFIQHFHLNSTYADLLFDLSNSYSCQHLNLIPFTTLVRYGILKKQTSHDTIIILRAYGARDEHLTITEGENECGLLLGWDVVVQLFKMMDNETQKLIDQAIILYVAYDAYDQQRILKNLINHVSELENNINVIESDDENNPALIHPYPLQ